MSKHAPWGNTFIPFSTNVYLCFLAEIVNMGRKRNIPITDIASPPIVPAARGNQKGKLKQR